MADNYVIDAGKGDFVIAHQKIFGEISVELNAELQDAVHEGGKAARSNLRRNSPKSEGGGEYARSWGCDFTDHYGHHEAAVVNRKHWPLTHLLTDGHDSYNQHGGPYGHVPPADETYVSDACDAGLRVIEQKLGVG